GIIGLSYNRAMPKIAPRPEIVNHPLYQATMAAQHLAYQIMREVPPDQKADATRLHLACVQMSTYTQYGLDPGVPDKPGHFRGLAEACADAQDRLAPIRASSGLNEADALDTKLAEIAASAEAERQAQSSSAA
ncbi:MAG: hypothetical protein ABIT01_19070, partial [Thermoanaerobaculia bacterium]